VPWISIAIPTRERRRASREDAVTILSLIFALSGDLHKETPESRIDIDNANEDEGKRWRKKVRALAYTEKRRTIREDYDASK